MLLKSIIHKEKHHLLDMLAFVALGLTRRLALSRLACADIYSQLKFLCRHRLLVHEKRIVNLAENGSRDITTAIAA